MERNTNNSRARPRLDARNKKIYDQFEKMFNVDGLRIEIIYSRLAEKWYLSDQSIQKIVLKQASAKNNENGKGQK